ncbi:SpaH/EbpB family LPXTG-anchored major pilin [Enterococcus sp. DIV0756]|uniref:SpaH/EbpB family LPXTG-anchored major pilin n=1 Tax=Enterococcus sp. DIV0756 TaxID=2774636 RepID=UPI003F279784
MKNKRKWISKIALTLGVLTMLGASGAGAVPMVYAADDKISTNPVSDHTSDRTITLWKYEINSAAELGDRGTGDPSMPPSLAGKQVMKDVKFEIVKIVAIPGGKSLVNPLDTVEGTDWEVDTEHPYTATGTTDENGKLKFDVSTGMSDKKDADGIYIVREIPDASGNYTYTKPGDPTATPPVPDETGLKVTKPMDPFFVHLPQTKRDDTSKLIYDVHVHPKNIVANTELDKTVEGGKGFSIKAGNSFQWEATTTLPEGLYAIASQDMTITDYVDPADPTATPTDTAFSAGDEIYASYFHVTDEISADLMLEDATVYGLDTSGTPTQLVNGTDYKVTLDGTTIAPGAKVEDLTTGTAKKVVVSLTKDGMKKLGVNNLPKLQVVYKVKADNDFNGTISNQYTIDYLLPGGTPDTNTSDKPEYYDGGFDIKKTDDKGTALADAEFYLAETEADAKEGIFLASNGKSYRLKDHDTDTSKLAEDPADDGATFLTAKSDATGKAEFNGLKLDWFTDSNGNGKQDPSIDSEKTWQKEKPTDPDDRTPYISKKYWLVETKSPSGYELLKSPVEVTVTLTSHDDVVIDVENKPKTDLPFTGGTGTMLLVIIAIGSITIGTASIAIDKKRRQA